MAELNGFIKLHRKLIEWGWYSDHVVKDVFLHILMIANFKEGEYMGHKLMPGDAIIGRKQMAKDLGFSEQQIRTALNKLASTGEIVKKSTNKFTVVTVVNWSFYQFEEKLATNEQPTSNQQATNNQPHLKNDKNDKNDKNIGSRPYFGSNGYIRETVVPKKFVPVDDNRKVVSMPDDVREKLKVLYGRSI